MQAQTLLATFLLAATITACGATRSTVHGDLYQPDGNPRRLPLRIVGVEGKFRNIAAAYPLARGAQAPRRRNLAQEVATMPVSAIDLEPGSHTLLVALADNTDPGRAVSAVTINVKPCSRYYIAGERDTSVSRTWRVVVDRVIPIEGCQTKGTATAAVE